MGHYVFVELFSCPTNLFHYLIPLNCNQLDYSDYTLQAVHLLTFHCGFQSQNLKIMHTLPNDLFSHPRWCGGWR